MTNLNNVAADDENNNQKSIIDAFDCEPGYYYQVVRSMLMPGHETELIYWFKSMGLIPTFQICPKAKLQTECNKLMEWIPAKTVDFYQWKCRNCNAKKNIRENSPFQESRCSFANGLRILLGWCKGLDLDSMSNLIGVKKHSVRVLYNTATARAKKHLKKYQIGGPGIVVLVDTYPEGCTNTALARSHSNRPILCLAEAKEIPPKYWLEALDTYSRTNPTQVTSTKMNILRIIEDVVRPGSILVTRDDSTLCNSGHLRALHNLFPTVVTVEALSRHDHQLQSIQDNLETIWRLALDICEQSQFFTAEQVPFYLLSQMWQRQYGGAVYEQIINCLTDVN